MSMEKQSDKKLLENIDGLLVDNTTTLHEIPVDPGDPNVIIRVWLKDLSFLKAQEAIKEVVQITPDGIVEIDFGGYWKFMFNECIDKTEPNLSLAQLLALKPEIAIKITALLPQPEELVTGPLEDGPTA